MAGKAGTPQQIQARKNRLAAVQARGRAAGAKGKLFEATTMTSAPIPPVTRPPARQARARLSRQLGSRVAETAGQAVSSLARPTKRKPNRRTTSRSGGRG